MAVEGGRKYVKFLLFFLYFISFSCTLAPVFMACQIPDYMLGTTWVIIAVVVCFFLTYFGLLISFLGFFTWREAGDCIICVVSVLLYLIIFAEIGAAISMNTMRGNVSTMVDNSLTMLNEAYMEIWNNQDRDTVDMMQMNLKCCGINNSTDWIGFGPDGKTVPDSCCVNVTPDCGKGTMKDAAKVHAQGCHAPLTALMENTFTWGIKLNLGIALLQMLCNASAWLLIGITGAVPSNTNQELYQTQI